MANLGRKWAYPSLVKEGPGTFLPNCRGHYGCELLREPRGVRGQQTAAVGREERLGLFGSRPRRQAVRGVADRRDRPEGSDPSYIPAQFLRRAAAPRASGW